MSNIVYDVLTRSGFACVGLYGFGIGLMLSETNVKNSKGCYLNNTIGFLSAFLLVMSGIAGVLYSDCLPIIIASRLAYIGLLMHIIAFIIPNYNNQ